MNYTSLLELLSACGVSCLLINNENTIISVNERADLLLDGSGQLPGKKLPDVLIPLVDELRSRNEQISPVAESSEDGSSLFSAPSKKSSSPPKELLPVSAGTGDVSSFFTNVLPSSCQPGVYARLSFGRYVCCEALLSHPLLPGDTKLLILRDASRDHALDMTAAALDQIHEAVVICDEEDRMYFCNMVALEIDDLVFDKIGGQNINEVYENEDYSPLSIPETRKRGTPSLNHRQFYHSKSGQRRETIANFFPVLRGDKVLGAFSVLEDWDTASSLQRKVIDLQDRLLDYEQVLKNSLPADSPAGSDERAPGAFPVATSSAGNILRAQHRFADFVQQSSIARNTVKLCTEAGVTEYPVFLYGEAGTGKHFLAQCIHNVSSRAASPFLHFSCASLPAVLLDDMLFGAVRNASQDAEEKRGLLAQAEGGTLYLSEIETMNLQLQRKLLHVLQNRVFSRNGEDLPVPLNTRFVISTSLTPEKAIESRKLDPSLFSYLHRFRIMVPPLRTRRADIIPLTMEFVNTYNHRYSKRIITVSDNIFTLFKKYPWSGNIKELKQALGYAINAVPPDVEILTTEYLPARISKIRKPVATAAPGPAVSPDAVVLNRPVDSAELKDTVTEIRRQSIYQILVKHGGNITKTAAEMGLSRQNLQYHIRQCGIDLAEIRAAAKKK